MTEGLPFTAYAPGTRLPRNSTAQYIEDYVEAGLVHTIHVSERRAFRSCRQRWSWAYEDDLHSIESIRALEFGSAYHRAMEVFYDPATWHLDKFVLQEHAIAEFKTFTQDTQARFQKLGMVDERLLADFDDRLSSGEAMLRHYFAAIAPITDTFEPVEIEIAFEVPLLDPDGNYLLCKCDRCRARV